MEFVYRGILGSPTSVGCETMIMLIWSRHVQDECAIGTIYPASDTAAIRGTYTGRKCTISGRKDWSCLSCVEQQEQTPKAWLFFSIKCFNCKKTRLTLVKNGGVRRKSRIKQGKWKKGHPEKRDDLCESFLFEITGRRPRWEEKDGFG